MYAIHLMSCTASCTASCTHETKGIVMQIHSCNLYDSNERFFFFFFLSWEIDHGMYTALFFISILIITRYCISYSALQKFDQKVGIITYMNEKYWYWHENF